MRSRLEPFKHLPGLEVVEKSVEPELAARLHVRETPTVVQVTAGTVRDAAVGPRACLRLLRRLTATST